MFLTNQGEGAWLGQLALFVRLQGCSVGCPWCDTEYDTGAAYEPVIVAERARSMAPRGAIAVVTGGEPTDQALAPLVDALHEQDFRVHLETSGVRPVTARFDWIVVSPKQGFAKLAQRKGDELKLVAAYPPDDVGRLERFAAPFLDLDFKHFWMQPLEHPRGVFNIDVCQRLTAREPRWRLSIQAHKHWGIP